MYAVPKFDAGQRHVPRARLQWNGTPLRGGGVVNENGGSRVPHHVKDWRGFMRRPSSLLQLPQRQGPTPVQSSAVQPCTLQSRPDDEARVARPGGGGWVVGRGARM